MAHADPCFRTLIDALAPYLTDDHEIDWTAVAADPHPDRPLLTGPTITIATWRHPCPPPSPSPCPKTASAASAPNSS